MEFSVNMNDNRANNSVYYRNRMKSEGSIIIFTILKGKGNQDALQATHKISLENKQIN